MTSAILNIFRSENQKELIVRRRRKSDAVLLIRMLCDNIMLLLFNKEKTLFFPLHVFLKRSVTRQITSNKRKKTKKLRFIY